MQRPSLARGEAVDADLEIADRLPGAAGGVDVIVLRDLGAGLVGVRVRRGVVPQRAPPALCRTRPARRWAAFACACACAACCGPTLPVSPRWSCFGARSPYGLPPPGHLALLFTAFC